MARFHAAISTPPRLASRDVVGSLDDTGFHPGSHLPHSTDARRALSKLQGVHQTASTPVGCSRKSSQLLIQEANPSTSSSGTLKHDHTSY
jgi:hypothetical protein